MRTSAEDSSRVMGAYFAALGSGRFQQFLTEDVTWTTIQGAAQIQGAAAVEESVNGLHARMSDLQTRQLAVTDGTAYLEGSCAGQDVDTRVPSCVAYDLAGGRIAAMRAYGDLASYMPPRHDAVGGAPAQ